MEVEGNIRRWRKNPSCLWCRPNYSEIK